MAYSSRFTGNTTVLSTRYAETTNGGLAGLLYVPDLPPGDSCVQETAPHVPSSAVRQSDLPPTNYHLVALAPWVSDRCASFYLAAARTDPVRAFLFYMPEEPDSPPPADSEKWYIGDGADWMAKTGYPVFAVSGTVGDLMMQHLSLYSGNMTVVPYGRNISALFLTDTEDYLRIWTELDVSVPPVPLGTWVYFLIVLGVLLTVISATSFLMHFVQARRRASLRRRVIAGEVNLEAMGIKHLTVPMEHVQNFPLFTYNYEPDISCPSASPHGEPGRAIWYSSRARSRPHMCGIYRGDGLPTNM
ncbi:55ece59b-9650-4fc8-80fd-642a36428402 [Thermothielavioides terrestris]|uniref:55ece59b-9650-4fc8-80fd-642a36428402 n=1 Tax=Thermothielavioides terrestris TaxID=2587410 RepID=A0A3S4C077_9PEZI|nr:55ece59b-9650-4fc8-80fd-642a36428402 [Thermothielavioides terrestris]